MRNEYRLLMKSTMLSSVFSIIIIVLTIYHHFHVDQLLKKANEQKHSS